MYEKTPRRVFSYMSLWFDFFTAAASENMRANWYGIHVAVIWSLAACVGCQLPVQNYPYHETGAAPQSGDSISAADRDRFEQSIVSRIVELRHLLDDGANETDPRVQAIARDLEESAVDWKTYLVKTDDSFKFPMMAYANHSWFQMRKL